MAKLNADDGAAGDVFGSPVLFSGGTLAVGAHRADVGGNVNQGAAYIFYRDQGGADNWGQVAKLTASDGAAGDYFGNGVVVSGDTVVVGAYLDGGGKGSAYVFERGQGGADNWGQVKKLTASDAIGNDKFGRSAAISVDTVVIGAHVEDGAGSDRGAAYVFERNQGGADSWGQVTKLTASDSADDDYFGRATAISGDTVVVGAYGEDGAGSDRGAAYIITIALPDYSIYLPLVLKN